MSEITARSQEVRREGRTAVVVGSGFGGLAIAIRLQAAGLQVTLVEKRERIGGRAYQLKDSGYVFDMGPSLITAPAILDDVFKAGGRRLTDYIDLMPLDPYYKIYFHDGSSIDYVGDVELMQGQMARFDEGDAARLPEFLDRIRPIYEAVIGDRLGSRPFETFGDMAGLVPRLVKLGAWAPAASLVKRYFKDPRHQFIYSFHPLFVGGNPFATPSIYLMIPYLEREGGVWFARGGMYSLVEGMGRLFIELGGRIATGAEVAEVLVERGRAVGVVAGGERFEADLVVSNADVGHTYRDLVPRSARRKWTDRRIERLDYSMSCFVLYMGVRKTYPQLEHHTLILTERYRGLLKDIFKKKILPDDFSMYLHAPTRTDPSMAPPGGESLYVLIPVANNRSGLDWSRLAEPFGNRVIDFLEEWGLDGLRQNLDVLHAFTPDDFETSLNSLYGNAFAIEPKLTQTAWFRPHNRSEDVRGLYLVGAGTHPGAGVPGTVLSAETTYSCIAEDLGLPAQWSPDERGRSRLEDAPAAGSVAPRAGRR